MSRKELTKAVAYLRTSSMTNVGEDKDSARRQRAAVLGFAKSAGYEVIAEYSDDGVKGADPSMSAPASPPCLSASPGTVCGPSSSGRPPNSPVTSSLRKPGGNSFRASA